MKRGRVKGLQENNQSCVVVVRRLLAAPGLPPPPGPSRPAHVRLRAPDAAAAPSGALRQTAGLHRPGDGGRPGAAECQSEGSAGPGSASPGEEDSLSASVCDPLHV